MLGATAMVNLDMYRYSDFPYGPFLMRLPSAITGREPL